MAALWTANNQAIITSPPTECKDDVNRRRGDWAKFLRGGDPKRVRRWIPGARSRIRRPERDADATGSSDDCCNGKHSRTAAGIWRM